jgi:nucleoid-associated protein YgaU
LMRAYAAGLRRVSKQVALAAINEYENLGKTAEEVSRSGALGILYSMTARSAVPLAALGLVAVAGLYAFRIMPLRFAELMFRSPAMTVPSTDVAQIREVGVSAAPRIPAVSNICAPQDAAAACEAPAPRPLLSPLADIEAGKHAGADSSSASRTMRPGIVTSLVPETQPKSHETLSYSVQRGDTIEGIALRHFGSPVKVETVIAANPQLRDVNRIYPGDTVFLPGEATPRDESGSR